MKISTFGKLILVAFVAWFGSYGHLYFFEVTGFKPLYSYMVLFGYFVSWCVVRRAIPALRDRGIQLLMIWLTLYVIYGCIAYVVSSQSDVAVQAVIVLLEAVVMLAVFGILQAERARIRAVQYTLALLAVFATIMNGYDFVNSTFTSVAGRAAGLYVNPNTSGHFIVMAMVAGLPVLPRRWRLPFIILCGAGTLVTFSRAAWILYGVGVMALGWTGEFGPKRHRWIAGVLAAVAGTGFVAMLFMGIVGQLAYPSSMSEYLDANTLARLGLGDSSFSGYAANERIALIWDSLRIGTEAPLFGHGIGHTSEWQFPVGPHNMYLLHWVEGGLIGLVLYLSLMVLLWRHSVGIGRVVTLQFIVAGLFTHNQLGQPAFLLLMAFVVAHGAARRQELRVRPSSVARNGPAFANA